MYTCLNPQVVNVGSSYVGHFVRVSYQNYPELFEAAKKKRESDHFEVNKMRYVVSHASAGR